MRKKMKGMRGSWKVSMAILILLPLYMRVQAQEVVKEYETWTAFSIDKKITDRLKARLTPEVRFQDGFTVDKYLIEAGVRYQLLKFLKLGTRYRFITNKRESKDTEYLHRFALEASLERKIRRFEPEFRLMYTNYADDDLDESYLRYKAALQYDIPRCKITPEIAAQVFHKLSAAKINKIRYGVGVRYQYIKNNYLGLFYKLDYYKLEYRNRHIFGISYKIKL